VGLGPADVSPATPVAEAVVSINERLTLAAGDVVELWCTDAAQETAVPTSGGINEPVITALKIG
jgi:hypothetical protein